MKVLVTGGAGFIGSNFIRRFIQGYYSEISQVLVLDKLTYAGNLENLTDFYGDSRFKFIQGDICDPKLLTKLVKNMDAIVNFAAESHVDRSIQNSEDFVNTNVVGVINMLDAIRKFDKNVRYLQVSTDEVYGSIKQGSWDENCSLLANSPYAASKASADLFVRAYHRTHNLNTIITRCSNNYGPYQYPEKLIPLFVTNLIEGKRLPLYGDGLNVRDWLHVNDHCDGIYLALTKGISGNTYNIGGGKELTNLEITKLVLASMQKDASMINFVEDRKGHDYRYSIDYKKISEELGYTPKVNFDEGIRHTIKWYLDNRKWWEPLKNK